MPRVLFWNLQTFGINKINDPSIKRPKGIGGNTAAAASAQRRTLVGQMLVAANPEIIVLVEVASGDSYPSDLATNTGGMQGAEYLLGWLRGSNPGMGWRLVPPLRVGRTPGSKPETVAVLYRGVVGAGQRYFTGPNRWSGGVNGFSRPGPAVGHAYGGGPPNLNAMVTPPGSVIRNIPGAALYNGGLAENVVSARTSFLLLNGGGDRVDYGVFRPPYMVTFTETDGMGAVTRNITLFGVHSPATAGDPNVYVTYLTQTNDIVAGLGANETRVIGGDFNLNLMVPNGGPSNVYAPLAPYTPLLQSAGAPAPVDLDAYRGYFATHIKPKKIAFDSLFLWSDNANTSPYPGYGYIGSDFFNNFYSIDNILVWPFQGPPYNYRTSIINGIAGSPFNLVAPVPGGAPTGTAVMAHKMLNPAPAVPWPPNPNAAVINNTGTRKNLTSWDNYGYQKSVSDHFIVTALI
jgi:hypothetical protein